jgi:hypothetical protein
MRLFYIFSVLCLTVLFKYYLNKRERVGREMGKRKRAGSENIGSEYVCVEQTFFFLVCRCCACVGLVSASFAVAAMGMRRSPNFDSPRAKFGLVGSFNDDFLLWVGNNDLGTWFLFFGCVLILQWLNLN